SRGIQGFTGSIGYTGSKGELGYTGSIGFTGSKGVQGAPGDGTSYIKWQEEFVATENQTIFNLTSGATYQKDTNAVSVFIWGVKQPNNSFIEHIDGDKITLVDGVSEGTRV